MKLRGCAEGSVADVGDGGHGPRSAAGASPGGYLGAGPGLSLLPIPYARGSGLRRSGQALARMQRRPEGGWFVRSSAAGGGAWRAPVARDSRRGVPGEACLSSGPSALWPAAWSESRAASNQRIKLTPSPPREVR